VGRVKPLTTKTELFELAPVTVTLAPVTLRVPEPVPLSPAMTLPRFMDVGLTVSCPAWVTETPVPVSGSVVVVVCALLVNVSVALAAPAAVGLKVTVKGTLPPTGMVAGNVKPLTVNAALFVLAAEMVTIAPAALKVPDAVPLLPTVTLPTLNVAGLTLRVPGCAVETPTPVRFTLLVAFDASLVMVAIALNVPVAFGENVTVTVVLCPEGTVIGRLGATNLKN
jgi:hypothetical protein